MSSHAFLNIATQAARAASRSLLDFYDRPDTISIAKTDVTITNAQAKSNEIIIDVLYNSYPEHNFCTLQTGLNQSEKNSEYTWIICGLDGEENFKQCIPIFSVSIALYHKGKPLIALVYQPLLDELFCAIASQGARLNRSKIRCDYTHSKEKTSLIAISDVTKILKVKSMSVFLRNPTRDIGCSSIALAYQASSRFAAYCATDQYLYNLAAGILIAQEAGSILTIKKEKSDKISQIYATRNNLQIKI